MPVRHVGRRSLVLVAILATFALLLPFGPASAHSGTGVSAFTGTAATGAIWSPYSLACPKVGALCDDGPNIPWSFTSSSDVVVHPGSPIGAGSARVSGSGTLTGWCGRSVGKGSVTLKNPASTLHTFNINWQSAGTFLILTDVSPPSRLVSIVNARAAGSSGTNVKCVTSAATSFTVVGVSAGSG